MKINVTTIKTQIPRDIDFSIDFDKEINNQNLRIEQIANNFVMDIL